MTPPVITIDGPSGAGKGTISRLLAQRLGYHLLDSGALYRLTALLSDLRKIDKTDELAVADLATAMDVVFCVEGEQMNVLLEGNDVSQNIREEQIGMGASIVAAHPKVRDALLERQRKFQQAPGLIADGRDMGTVVFPNAQVKFFLTASAEERARRRLLQLGETQDNKALYQTVLDDIQARDERDANRKTAPLKAAGDALVIDCTELSISEVEEKVFQHVNNKCAAATNV